MSKNPAEPDALRTASQNRVSIVALTRAQQMIRHLTILAITAVTATTIWATEAPAQGYYSWVVFRERSLSGIPVDQRRCRVEEIAPGQITFDEILARWPARAEALYSYRVLVSRGLCAP
jgi:hypothetical protein